MAFYLLLSLPMFIGLPPLYLRFLTPFPSSPSPSLQASTFMWSPPASFASNERQRSGCKSIIRVSLPASTTATTTRVRSPLLPSVPPFLPCPLLSLSVFRRQSFLITSNLLLLTLPPSLPPSLLSHWTPTL